MPETKLQEKNRDLLTQAFGFAKRGGYVSERDSFHLRLVFNEEVFMNGRQEAMPEYITQLQSVLERELELVGGGAMVDQDFETENVVFAGNNGLTDKNDPGCDDLPAGTEGEGTLGLYLDFYVAHPFSPQGLSEIIKSKEAEFLLEAIGVSSLGVKEGENGRRYVHEFASNPLRPHTTSRGQTLN